MPRYAPRLPFFSGGAPKEISISSDEWVRLSASWGKLLTDKQRIDVEWICNQHLIWREAETTATWADVRDLFVEAEKAAVAFSRLAWGELTPHSVQGAQLENLLDGSLVKYPVWLTGEDGSRYLYQMTKHDLSAIAGSVVSAVRDVKSHINSKLAAGRDGFMPGDAFRGWLMEMKKWAKGEKLPIRPYEGDGGPGRLPIFLFNLQKLFPADLQDNIASPEAIATRLKRAQRGANSPPKID